MHASAPGANVPPPADQDAQQSGAPGVGGPAMTHAGWPTQGLLDPGTKGAKGFIGDMSDQSGLSYNMAPHGAVLGGLGPAGGMHSLAGSHSLQATSTTIMDHPGLQPTESSAVYGGAGPQLVWPGARAMPAQHQGSMHTLLQQAQLPHQHRTSMGPPAAQQYPQQLQQQEQQLHIAQLQAQLPHQQQQQQQQLPHGVPNRGPIGSSPLLQPQLTESSVFARTINPALQYSRVDPAAAEAAAAGEAAAAAAAAAGLAGPQGPMQGGIQGSVQGSVQLPGAAGSQQGRDSFTGFTPGPGGASLGSAPMWMAGAQQQQQQGPLGALGAMSQGLPGSMGPPHSISGLSGPSSLGGPDSEMALLQAALRGGGSDDLLRLYAMKKLLGDGSSGGGGGGGGVDVTTLLLLQSMNRDQRGGQQGSNDMLIQLLLQRQQGQGQQGQQSQVLQALLAQQQQQQPSQMQPPSLLEAPASTTGGPGSSGAWGAVAHSTAPGQQHQQQHQPAAAVQPRQQQQQQVVPAVYTPPAAAAQPAVFSNLPADDDQKPPAAAADTKQQQQQEEAAAAAATTAAATASSEAKDTQGVAAQQPDKAAPPAAPGATKETPKQQQPAVGQEQQKAKPAEQAAARATATAAAAAAGLDPAAAAAMPVNDAADQELEQLVADTLMYMAAPQAGTRSPSGAATAAAAAAAGAPAVSAALAAVPGGAVPLKVEQQQQQQGGAESAATAGRSQEQQQQLDDDKDMLPAAGDSYQEDQGQAAAADQQQPVELQEPEPDVPRQEPEEGLWQRVLHHLFFYLQEDIQALEALAGTQPAAKKPRPSPADGPLPPDRTALSGPDRQALDEVLTLLKERQTPVGDGFWQRAWHHVQRYLRLTDDTQQQQQQSSEPSDAASVGSKRNLKDAASVEPVPLQDLPPPEAAALQKILEPIRKDQIATLQQRLEGLAGYGQQLPGVQGADAAGAADPAAAAAAAANAMMMQQMGYPSFDPTYGAWGMYGMGEGDEGGYDMGQWAGGYGRVIRGRGGRPKGSGNRVQMAPRPPAPDAAEASQAKFSLRSVKYTGVYRSRRSQEGWRAQFCYANKVINLGTFATEEAAARVWNEAALLFRGADAWLNPVEPQLPEDYKAGELHLASDKAASAVIAAAVAAGLPQPKVVVKPQ